MLEATGTFGREREKWCPTRISSSEICFQVAKRVRRRPRSHPHGTETWHHGLFLVRFVANSGRLLHELGTSPEQESQMAAARVALAQREKEHPQPSDVGDLSVPLLRKEEAAEPEGMLQRLYKLAEIQEESEILGSRA